MRKIIYLVVSLLLLVSLSCHKNDPIFNRLGNEYEVIKLTKTSYKYGDLVVYKANHTLFQNSNDTFFSNLYFLSNGIKLYELNLNENDRFNYTYDKCIVTLSDMLKDTITDVSINKYYPNTSCIISCKLIGDFNWSIKDTHNYIHHWSYLEYKFYDNILSDTVYLLCRGVANIYKSGYFISRKYGIVGSFEADERMSNNRWPVYNPLGNYLDRLDTSYYSVPKERAIVKSSFQDTTDLMKLIKDFQ